MAFHGVTRTRTGEVRTIAAISRIATGISRACFPSCRPRVLDAPAYHPGMPKRKDPFLTKSKAPPRQRAKGRSLVRVDQGPLRRKAASECARAMERLETARTAWRRFEREDQPAYRRWVATTFGVLMSRIREIEGLVREK